MININHNIYQNLKGIIFHKNEVIGVVDSASSFLDMLCQIKNEQCSDYKMEVEVEVEKGIKRTYVYHFTKDGTMIPSSYPGIELWMDVINKKLLYMYNFSTDYTFSLSKK